MNATAIVDSETCKHPSIVLRVGDLNLGPLQIDSTVGTRYIGVCPLCLATMIGPGTYGGDARALTPIEYDRLPPEWHTALLRMRLYVRDTRPNV